jgi:hypothetical protein
MTKAGSVQQILALPMDKNDANAATIGDYLVRLAEQAWVEEEGFSGKRPFGNSGWQHEIYIALIKNEAITGELDEYGYIEDYDGQSADRIMTDVLRFLRKIDWANVQEYKEPEDWYIVLLDRDMYGSPVIVDKYDSGYTQEEAKRIAKGANEDSGDTRWRAIHLPK